MNNQKIINEIKDLLSKLEQEIKNIKDMEKFKNFIPKEGEYYFFINIDGTIGSFVNTNSLFDKDVLKRNRAFKTEEHAEQYLDFMEMLKEKHMPFNLLGRNCSIFYDHENNLLDWAHTTEVHRKELYFDKKEATQLIKDYPNELKHWYLETLYED